MKITTCRICGNVITPVIAFGKMPIVNYYLSQEELLVPEKKYDLTFCMCSVCTLGQLAELVTPKDIFVTYHYASSTSSPLQTHLESLANLCRKKFNLDNRTIALDIGCNDGILLASLQAHGVKTLGIDPAKNIVAAAAKKGIPVIADFFTQRVAKTIVKDQQFDLITATNTLAQIIDLDDFMQGIKMLLKPEGVFVAEVGYLLDMIEKKTFDSIYHEHFSYFTLRSLEVLCNKYNLTIFDAETISNHGGSLRIFVMHTANKKRIISKRLLRLLQKENTYALDKKATYAAFSNFFHTFKVTFKEKLLSLKGQGKTIIGLGSPAKSVILLNYIKIGTDIIDYIVDSTPEKQYRFMPGVHIPIFPETKLATNTSKEIYFLLLAWTYKKEILHKFANYRKMGAKVIIPFPTVKVV